MSTLDKYKIINKSKIYINKGNKKELTYYL